MDSFKLNIANITPIGSILAFMHEAIPPSFLLCDGSSYFIEDYPALFQVIGTKFGEDELNKFKVPDLREKFLKGSVISGIDETAGLPDISGTATSFVMHSGLQAYDAFYDAGTVANNDYYGKAGLPYIKKLGFQASRSNPIYGNSDTVTPQNMSVVYCIKAYL